MKIKQKKLLISAAIILGGNVLLSSATLLTLFIFEWLSLGSGAMDFLLTYSMALLIVPIYLGISYNLCLNWIKEKVHKATLIIFYIINIITAISILYSPYMLNLIDLFMDEINHLDKLIFSLIFAFATIVFIIAYFVVKLIFKKIKSKNKDGK